MQLTIDFKTFFCLYYRKLKKKYQISTSVKNYRSTDLIKRYTYI